MSIHQSERLVVGSAPCLRIVLCRLDRCRGKCFFLAPLVGYSTGREPPKISKEIVYDHTMAGLGGTLVSSEDSMDEGERSEVNSQRKRGLSHGSESEDASERVVRRKMDQEGLKMLVNFKEGHDIKSVGPVALTKFLRKKVGEVTRARVHSDGDLMIVCKDEGQQLKALKLKSVCKK